MQRLTHKRESGMKSGYWSPNKKQELVDRLAMYEDAAEKDRFGKWIPCSERLPEKGESVLCYAKTRDGGYEAMRVGACHKGFWFFQDGGSERLCFPGNYVAVAWMELPKPYKGE